MLSFPFDGLSRFCASARNICLAVALIGIGACTALPPYRGREEASDMDTARSRPTDTEAAEPSDSGKTRPTDTDADSMPEDIEETDPVSDDRDTSSTADFESDSVPVSTASEAGRVSGVRASAGGGIVRSETVQGWMVIGGTIPGKPLGSESYRLKMGFGPAMQRPIEEDR